jgi:catechol 2,3-dioxygenase-like lactoylglutathione lyase family enzyme
MRPTIAISWLLGIVGAATLLTPSRPLDAAPAAAIFHHLLIRVAAQTPTSLRDYYYSLFDAKGVARENVKDAAGIASGNAHLLFRGGPAPRPEPSALWHFGWGNVVLNETYAQHYFKEIEWKDPRVSLVDRFHLHLNSADPEAAAKWYAQALGAELLLGTPAPQSGAEDVKRPAEAFAKFGDVILSFYRTSDALVCSKGQRVDHLAVIGDRARATNAPRISNRCGQIDLAAEFGAAVAVEGPDGFVIEVMDPS